MSTLSDHIKFGDIYAAFPVEGGGGTVCSYKDYLDKMTIVHLTGPMKPWEFNMPWYTDMFMKYYNLSLFHDKILDLKSPLEYLNSKKTPPISLVELLVPYKVLKPDSRIVIYGAGVLGHRCKEQMEQLHFGELVVLIAIKIKKQWSK